MKIGIDAKRALCDPSEYGDRARNIIRALADNYPDVDFLLYTPKLPKQSPFEAIKSYHNVRVCLPPPSGFGGELWRTFGIPNNLPADRVDLYFGIDGELPMNIQMSGKPSVLLLPTKEDNSAKKTDNSRESSGKSDGNSAKRGKTAKKSYIFHNIKEKYRDYRLRKAKTHAVLVLSAPLDPENLMHQFTKLIK